MYIYLTKYFKILPVFELHKNDLILLCGFCHFPPKHCSQEKFVLLGVGSYIHFTAVKYFIANISQF